MACTASAHAQSVEWTLEPQILAQYIGRGVLVLDDLDADRTPEYAYLSERRLTGEDTHVVIRSGRTQAIHRLVTFPGLLADDSALSDAGDFDGDGLGDLLVGFAQPVGGEVHVIAADDGAILAS